MDRVSGVSCVRSSRPREALTSCDSGELEIGFFGSDDFPSEVELPNGLDVEASPV